MTLTVKKINFRKYHVVRFFGQQLETKLQLKILLQEKYRDYLAWAFQRDSQLLPIFNYHLQKLHENGFLDRMYHQIIGDNNRNTDDSKIQSISGLSYENVTLPFLALLTGLGVALLVLGIETAIICKKKCLPDKDQWNEDEPILDMPKEIIDDIHNILIEKHCNLEDIEFLSKIRMSLARHDNSR